MSDDTQEHPLLAIHQVDIPDVLGEPLPRVWTCSACGREMTGVPAAFLKKEGHLVPLCFACFLDRDDRTSFE